MAADESSDSNAGINALPREVQSRIRERVETFDDFNTGNDPYGGRAISAFAVEESVASTGRSITTTAILSSEVRTLSTPKSDDAS